jgi:di/tripeptidase
MDMISFGPTIRGAHSPDEELVFPHRKILEIF